MHGLKTVQLCSEQDLWVRILTSGDVLAEATLRALDRLAVFSHSLLPITPYLLPPLPILIELRRDKELTWWVRRVRNTAVAPLSLSDILAKPLLLATQLVQCFWL